MKSKRAIENECFENDNAFKFSPSIIFELATCKATISKEKVLDKKTRKKFILRIKKHDKIITIVIAGDFGEITFVQMYEIAIFFYRDFRTN